ncbi:MAG: hypothetical protein ACREIT_03980 [Tepidisphaeraceae bacterium]
MPTTLAIRRRRRLWKRGIGLPGDNSKIISVARYLTSKIDAPVLGGIAVILHGYLRTTVDLDLYTSDRAMTNAQLRSAGARWDTARREHLYDDVRIHTVTPDDAGHVVERVSTIDGVRVVSLKDLIIIKLRCGLNNAHRGKDIGDVTELIGAVPLDKRFAGKLPTDLRAEFKKLVDAVRAAEKVRKNLPRF